MLALADAVHEQSPSQAIGLTAPTIACICGYGSFQVQLVSGHGANGGRDKARGWPQHLWLCDGFEAPNPFFSERFLTDYTLICNICENELILVFFSTAFCQMSKNAIIEKNAFLEKMEQKQRLWLLGW